MRIAHEQGENGMTGNSYGVVHERIERRDGGEVLHLTIDRRDKLNALGGALVRALADKFLAVGGDIRAVVLAGAGERSFIGGADIAAMSRFDPQAAREFIAGLERLCSAIRASPVPVVAWIHGYCFGAGLEIAACCDLRVASHSSAYAMPEVHVGIPSVIQAALLPSLIGAGRARDLVMTGRRIDAEEAWRMGFLDRLVADDVIDDAVNMCLDDLLRGGRKALRLQKDLCNGWDALPLDQSVTRSIKLFGEAFEGEEPKRMMRAFLDRPRKK
jgi:enoyl-CoA hydratase